MQQFKTAGMAVWVEDSIEREPTIGMLEQCLRSARHFAPDSVIGLGGGSVMDVAKLVAALIEGGQSIQDTFGINLLCRRKRFLACVPTTSGTGSEVSPNAILLDESCQLKKGVISPHLVPDVAIIDPLATCSVPAHVTAATGIDALTHCIEGYANNFAHPMIDLYALEGIRLICGSLLEAVEDGADTVARGKVALGSLYGGLCLGPVNTAAVHALAYPLGSRFHVAHGISNAVLLPHVLRFNLQAGASRYGDIAIAAGAPPGGSMEETAERGIQRIEEIMARCPIPRSISELRVPVEALPGLAKEAILVTRLLKNNPCPISEAEALEVYRAAW
jgi:alcohol dehydrogenase class IV